MYSRKRLALVVGVQTYDAASIRALKNPVADATEISSLLVEAGGFHVDDVVVALDCDITQLREHVEDFRAKIKAARANGSSSLAVFYFAGKSTAAAYVDSLQ